MFEILYDQYNPKYETIPLGHQGENEARCLIWDITPYIDEFADGTVQVKVTEPDTDGEVVYWASNVTKTDGVAKWTLTSVDTANSGIGLCELFYYGSNGEVLAKSPITRFEITPTQGASGDAPDPYEDLLDRVSLLASQAQAAAITASSASTSAQSSADRAALTAENIVDDEASIRAAADSSLQTQIYSLMGAVGSPLVAPVVSAMSDTTKIYVYTGSESGYTYGNWYYYNGSQWVSGGVYNSTAVNTDKTLTVEDMAADASRVGELRDQLYSNYDIGRASGMIASFDDGADDIPFKSMSVNIESTQDFNGYDAPWSGGSGINIMKPIERTTIAYGLTFVSNPSGLITVTGTATGSGISGIIFADQDSVTLTPGTTYMCKAFGISDASVSIQLYVNGSAVRNGTAISVSINEGDEWYIRVRVSRTPDQVYNESFYVMLTEGSTEYDQFYPYENICPIVGHDKTNITVASKNLVKLPDKTETVTDTTFVASEKNGTVTINGTSAASRFRNYMYKSGDCPFPRNVPLKVMGGYAGIVVRICVTYKGSSETINLAYSSVSQPVAEFVITDDITTAWIRVATGAGNTYNNTVVRPMVLVASENDATFEVGKRTEYTVSFDSAGAVYNGLLNPITGMLTITHRSVTINGSEPYWYTVTGHPHIYSTTSADLTVSPIHQTLDILTNQGYTPTIYNYAQMDNNIPAICMRANEASIWRMYISTEKTTLADLKAYLAENPLQVVYPLANPISYQLTPQNIKSFMGKNNVWVDDYSIENLEYRSDKKNRMIYAAFVTDTASGSIASFADGADDVPVKNMSVNITAQQKGTGDPSPSNIVPIIGFDSATVKVSGKNLLDQNYINLKYGGKIRGLSINRFADGTFSLNGTSDNTAATVSAITDPFLLKAGSYVFSGAYTTATANPLYLRVRKKGETTTTVLSGNGSFTLSEDTMVDVVIYFRAQAVVDNILFEPMIRLSGADSTYEPTKQKVYNISFGLGDAVYGGSLDAVRRILTINKIKIAVNDSTRMSGINFGWTVGTNANRLGFPISTALMPTTGSSSGDIIRTGELCNMGVVSSNADSNFTVGACQLYRGTAAWYFRYCVDTSITDAESAYQYLVTNGCEFTIPLVNPMLYQLETSDISTILGQNYVFADCGDITDLEYRADTKLYINKLINS